MGSPDDGHTAMYFPGVFPTEGQAQAAAQPHHHVNAPDSLGMSVISHARWRSSDWESGTNKTYVRDTALGAAAQGTYTNVTRPNGTALSYSEVATSGINSGQRHFFGINQVYQPDEDSPELFATEYGQSSLPQRHRVQSTPEIRVITANLPPLGSGYIGSGEPQADRPGLYSPYNLEPIVSQYFPQRSDMESPRRRADSNASISPHLSPVFHGSNHSHSPRGQGTSPTPTSASPRTATRRRPPVLNDKKQYICENSECGDLTFDRKCEWR